MTAPPGKTRTRAHVLADLSINYVERQVLLSASTIQRMQSDYGYDLLMCTFNARGEIEPGIVYFQVKATDDLPMLADGTAVPWVVSRRDLRLWLGEAFPVILVVYDGQRDRAYWLHVQGYFADRPATDLFLAGETITVHIPASHRLNRRAVERIVQQKNLTQGYFPGRGPNDV
jgi:hypothetical protein